MSTAARTSLVTVAGVLLLIGVFLIGIPAPTVSIDAETEFLRNTATTSNNDIYGPYTLGS